MIFGRASFLRFERLSRACQPVETELIVPIVLEVAAKVPV